jgi:ABC-type transport system involved in multi-copper enzyme maturation permease subunit
VTGLLRAELLRFRKRRSLQVIVLGVPLLIGVFFVLGYSSIYHSDAFDPARARQELIDMGYVVGVPPEEADQLLDEAVESQRQGYAMQEEGERLTRAAYVFPNSLATVFGFGTLVIGAMLLLTATTIGDEFNWGTIRTTLLASANRRRLLAVRLFVLLVTGALLLVALLLVGVLAPLLLNIRQAQLPAALPEFDFGALLVLAGGLLVASAAVVALIALVTLLFRSGPLALVVLPVYVAVEAAVLVALTRLPSFGGTQGPDGNFVPGVDAWLLDAFPLRGLTTLSTVAGRAATGLPSYPGEAVARDVTAASLPLITFTVLAVVLGGLAFRRFQRMDIAE